MGVVIWAVVKPSKMVKLTTMGKFVKGHIPHNKGKRTPPEVGEKIRLANLRNGNVPPSREGCIPWNKDTKGLQISWCKGKNLSREHKKKLSEAHKGKTMPLITRIKLSKYTKEKRYNYKGTVPLQHTIRQCYKSRLWRSSIFNRDDFTCVSCGTRGGNLEADHYPKLFKDIFYTNNIKELEQALDCEEFWNTDNGRTLCKPCHKKVTYATS